MRGTNDWPLSCKHAEAARCVQDKMGWVAVCAELKEREEAGGDRCKFSECPNLFLVRIVVCAGQK